MLDDVSLLLAWERGYGRAPFEQALVLLGIAFPNTTVNELMNLTIGKRDAALLSLRKRLFGDRLESLANCPDCNETLELSFSVDDITLSQDCTLQSFCVELGDLQIDYRLPTSRDLLELTRIAPEHRADHLLLQCVSRVQMGESQVELGSLPPATRQMISNSIADSDPQADIQLGLTCLNCGHKWNSPFDIVGFLWTELNVWSQRLLAEVHLLAKAYGWTESETLALSRWRRQIYLGMVRQ